jgi:arylsulfatase A
VQLYDLEDDIAETKNVQEKYPEIVKELTSLLETYKRDGRSVQRQQTGENNTEQNFARDGLKPHP